MNLLQKHSVKSEEPRERLLHGLIRDLASQLKPTRLESNRELLNSIADAAASNGLLDDRYGKLPATIILDRECHIIFLFQNMRNFRTLASLSRGNEICKNISLTLCPCRQAVCRKFLTFLEIEQHSDTHQVEKLIQALASLPDSSNSAEVATGLLLKKLWDNLDHPPLSLMGPPCKLALEVRYSLFNIG